MNEHSSRSHVLVMLTVTKRAARVGSSPTGTSLLARVGKLYLVDLAGSERLKKSRSTGAAALE
jgi:kinesin family protein 5